MKKKIGEQIRHWRDFGVEVRLFILGYKECRRAWEEVLNPSEFVVHLSSRRWERLRALERIADDLRRWAPEFLYMRQETYYPAIGHMMTSTPTFIELNGDEVSETRSGPLYYWLYQVASRYLVLRNARGLVAVSGELAAAPGFTRFGLPTTVIGNGIALSDFPELPAPTNGGLRFGFLGSPLGARWHGVEKIVHLAWRRPDWQFELIGPDPTQLGKIPSNVRTYGVLPRERYQPILAQCDIGVGVLSGYEKQSREASALKAREYLAYGIPIVSAVLDTDFLEGAPFLLVLPNTPDNVSSSIDEIERFAKQWKGKRVERSQVRHLDSSLKEQRRLEFIARVIAM
ncbi:MAG TPA: glycosyltransferase [Polyangiaceae bacterium]|nr:glycosyltransferase [Polyangiaceae bacterium]